MQVVAKGRLNMADKSIALHVEPRLVGKPFARSAFPVEISGTIADPKFRILFAGLPGDRSGRHLPFFAKPLQDHQPCVPN